MFHTQVPNIPKYQTYPSTQHTHVYTQLTQVRIQHTHASTYTQAMPKP